tara:strand:+ start:76 stop:261 length:186 start_codon:yes stop_codon:yes gene_type:complete
MYERQQVMPHGRKHGLYENIRLRRASGKPMRKKGQKGAPTEAAFKKAALTAKPPKKKVKKK